MSNPVRMTIPVSVTVEIDVDGSIPDTLVKEAAYTAVPHVVDEALAYHYPRLLHSVLGKYQHELGDLFISVKGVTALFEPQR